MVLLSSIIGLVGMTFGAIFLLYHLASLETFGVPYLSPFAANEGIDLEDSIVRAPLDRLKFRPRNLKTPNKRRQK
jgi:spore germination protein KA